MNQKLYEHECLIRRPSFRRDFIELLDQNPRVREMYEGRWSGGKSSVGSDDIGLRALQVFRKKYPTFDDMDEMRLIQSSPVVFDPAWHVAVDQAVVRFLGRASGKVPRGLITRAGLNPDLTDSPEAQELYPIARTIFEEMDEQTKKGWRQMLGTAAYRNSRIFVPIAPDTTLEQVQRLWPLIERARRACFGNVSPRRASRRYIFEDRIRAWDVVREEGLPVREAIKRSGLRPRTFWRRYFEARRDIEGVKREKIDSNHYADHVSGCPTCQEAERTGKSDHMCTWMQTQLGSRSGRSTGASVPLEVEEGERARRWRA